ncbi:protein kinase [Dactylosporangium sp. NPDC000244]|uniref:serine/threonine protein kinase n=1 Tax=Dactylosporangium sp. NPDC000244 TaxID=3154365 RepID=UPI0033278B01
MPTPAVEREPELVSSAVSGVVIDPDALATGAVATVYPGRRADTGAEVVVKLYAERFDRDTAARLDRERQALRTAGPVPSILPVDGVLEHPDGRSGVWMERCAGSLAGGGALPPSEVVRLGLTVATALAAAHDAGVVHGGVTPDNLLYRRPGELVVADFGVALRERFPRDVAHALEYTAPETLRDGTRTVATDLYGLGAVLYAALTGTPPFARRTGQPPGERVLRVLQEPVSAPDGPAELVGVILRLLAKHPDERPAGAAELVALFSRLSLDDPDDFDFDDFAAAAGPVAPLEAAPLESAPLQSAPLEAAPLESAPLEAVPLEAAPAGRTQVYSTEASRPPASRRRRWPVLLAGLGAAALGLTAVPIVLAQHGPRPPAGPPAVVERSAPAAPSSADAPAVNLRLAPPVDQGDHVELTWQADGDLDFAVVVAGERIDTMVLVANRQRTMRVPVDPARRYCFQVRATDGRHIYTTEPQPIRGATCKL